MKPDGNRNEVDINILRVDNVMYEEEYIHENPSKKKESKKNWKKKGTKKLLFKIILKYKAKTLITKNYF